MPSSSPSDRVAFVAPDTPIDLTNCDREPIHTPGAVQPHGALLVLRDPGLVVARASANAGSILGAPAERLVGAPLAALLGDDQARAVVAPLAAGAARAHDTVTLRRPGDGAPTTYDAAAHRADGVTILELEPRVGPHALTPHDFLATVRETMRRVEGAESVVGLAQAIAEQMRGLTGFDRVWVYRFHEDWHGEIIAEAKGDDIETWLGMHYPASDIPAQARALFLKNWLRMIPDVGFAPVPLVPRDDPAAPLDMGGTVLRSVSPIHIQYLQNMGVRASLVISLVHRGALWGLISGHHYSGPKRVPYATRTLCEFLAQAFSAQLGMAERVEDAAHALRLRETGAALVDRMGRDERWERALLDPALLTLAGATGAAVCVGGDVRTLGDTPPRAVIERLVAWLGERGEPLFATSALGAAFPPARPHARVASGLAAAHVSAAAPDYVLWFREECRQTVKWAGDPRKPVTIGDDGQARLHPRGSFELWEQEVQGTSAPWRRAELDAVAALRGTILEVLLRRADAIARLNAELEQANTQLQESAAELEVQAEELAVQSEELRTTTDELLARDAERETLLAAERAARAEAEAANRAKAEFLAMMSHELRTPLNAIGGYVQLLDMGIHGPVTPAQHEALDRVDRSQRHLLGIINSILNHARLEAGQVPFAATDVRLDAVMADVEALVAPQLTAKGLTYTWDDCRGEPSAPPLQVRADAEKVRQVLLNLVSNALKFTDAGGRVTVRCSAGDDLVAVRVEDTGRGIAHDRQAHIFDPFVQVDRHLTEGAQQGIGLGLAISRDLARGMGGDLAVESEPGVGSTFTLTLRRAR